MCESENILSFVLVWIAEKSADACLSLLDLSKLSGDPNREEVP